MCDPKSVKCGFCYRGHEVENICGHLHSEMTCDDLLVAAHHKCMQYSAKLVQYKFEHFGGFKIDKVLEELKRAKSLKCFICKKKKNKKTPVGGASAGCALKVCRRSYHYYCAKTDPDTVTKRLVVLFKAKNNKKTILYRVFCCAEHETQYRAKLKTYLAVGFTENTSDPSDDEEEEEEEEEDYQRVLSLSQNTENTSFVSLSDLDITPQKQRLGIGKTRATVSPLTQTESKTSKVSPSKKTAKNINNSCSTLVTKKTKSDKKDVKVPDAGLNTKLANDVTSKSPSPGKDSAKLLSPKQSPKMNPVVSLNREPCSFNSANKLNISESHIISEKSPKSSPSPYTKLKSPIGSDNSAASSKQKSSAVKSLPLDEDKEGRLKKNGELVESLESESETNDMPGDAEVYLDMDNENGIDTDSDNTIPPLELMTSDDDLEEKASKRSQHLIDKREYVLCIPAVSELTSDLRLAITRHVIQEAGSITSVLTWHDLHPSLPHNDKQITFLIKDIIECIQSNNIDELKKFLMNSKYLKMKINNEYKIQIKMLKDLDELSIESRILEKTWTKALQLLKTVSGVLESCNGSIFSVGSCRVLKMSITDSVDQDGTIRALWPKHGVGEEMMLWNDRTRLCSQLPSRYPAVGEEKLLEKWLSHLESPVCSVVVRPREAVLRISPYTMELVRHVQQNAKTSQITKGSTLLVFERVDTEVLDFDKYFKKVLQTINSTRHYIVLLPTAHVTSNANKAVIMSLLPDSLQSRVKVLTAADPTIMSCSWIVLQISSSSSSKDKVKTSRTTSAADVSPSSSSSSSSSSSTSVLKENRKRGRPSLHSTLKHAKKLKALKTV